MTNKIDFSIFTNFHFQTELLESVDWDDEELEKLINFINEFITDRVEGGIPSSKDDIDILINNVSNKWGQETGKVLRSIFNFEKLYLNLENSENEIVN